jgi:thioredoxin reductase/NAD-dependent dihydropyrimidine dehydrogenase PreA subunit
MSVVTNLRAWSHVAFGKKRPEPSYPRLPEVNDQGNSNVPGIVLTGEVAGTPLIKLGLNAGIEAVDRLYGELGKPDSDASLLDLLIVGAGSSGLGAAMRAHELGMRYLVLEGERIAMTIVNMYQGKWLFAEPEEVPNKSSLWFEECTREELLRRWHRQIKEVGLKINEFEKVEDIQRDGEVLVVKSTQSSYRARRVLLAVGKAGNPRKAGVPGETAFPSKVFHNLSDPDDFSGKNIFVYGGGDVAAECVLALSKTNNVTMVTIDEALTYPKKRNVDALRAEQAAGRLTLELSSRLIAFDADSVTYQTADGENQTVDNDVVFEMIGAVLPLKFFDRIGIRLEGSWHPKKWLILLAVFLGVYTLYALKKFPEEPYSWPFYLFIDEQGFTDVCGSMFAAAFAPFMWLFNDEARADLMGTLWFQQGYLYSLLYTIVMFAFGWQALLRWTGIAKRPKYQKWRFLSLITFQVVFFLVANVIAVQGVAVANSWRSWGLYAPWPLSFNTFFWWEDPQTALLVLFVGTGLIGTFVAIPLASRKHGKRFCTWICGCGGLAETLGDRWRHLSPKGPRSVSWNFQGTLILVAAVIVTVVVVGAFGTRADNAWAATYSYIVDFWLIAVVPVALYPFFGGKVWCRYWCPLAAWNGMLAKWYGKLKIRANDKCITCTLCSKYCQVGVDVMAFAKNQEYFDNANSNCIQCGICIDVCPMDVLYFDTSNADGPVTVSGKHDGFLTIDDDPIFEVPAHGSR